LLEPTPPEVGVALATTPVASDCEALYYKTTARDIYAPHDAHNPGVFDTLLFNERDEITEFTRGNVVAEIDGRCITPPVACGLLPGVLRAELLARDEIAEGKISRADLHRVAGLWFINSVRGMIPARLVTT
jgi:para-aminobenzoate synthetase / 4-amino-4-deoxychorismate lyase